MNEEVFEIQSKMPLCLTSRILASVERGKEKIMKHKWLWRILVAFCILFGIMVTWQSAVTINDKIRVYVYFYIILGLLGSVIIDLPLFLYMLSIYICSSVTAVLDLFLYPRYLWCPVENRVVLGLNTLNILLFVIIYSLFQYV